MDSSDTQDLDYKTRDWKYTQPLHNSYGFDSETLKNDQVGCVAERSKAPDSRYENFLTS